MKIVLTGATSMLGLALIDICIENNCEVLAIARQNSSRLHRIPASPLVKVVYADLDNIDKLEVDDEKYDAFYHFAWGHTAKAERDDPIAQEKNIQSTLSAVTLANRLGCKKFIGAGSQAEYGLVDGIITEDMRANPVTAYGMAKLSANLLSRRMCEQLGIIHIWTRIFSAYGINDLDTTMISYALKQFKNGDVACFSAGTQMWNYIFEKDAGRIFYLLGQKDIVGGIYHVAGCETKPLRSYIESMAHTYGNGAKCEFAEPTGKLYGIEPSTENTYHAIGFQPQISFEEGIKRIILSQCN